MKTAVIMFLIKRVVKFLKNHPDLIPGEIDNALIKFVADALGV